MFGSQAELREHKKLCSRSHNDSTSTTSLSPSLSDVEVLSDSESDTSEDSHKPSPPSNPSPVKSRSDAHIHVHVPGSRSQRRRGQRKKKINKSESSDQTTTQKKLKNRKLSSEATPVTSSSTPNFHKPSYYELGEVDVGPEEVSFNIGSDLSESSEDEDDLTYTSAEMAQLLSLNEQDMQYTDSSDSEEEEEEVGVVSDEGEDTHTLLEGRKGREGEGENVRRKKQQQQNKKKRGQSGGTKVDTASVTRDNSDRHSHLPHHAPHRSPAMSRQPEPVGLFWDIENCSVPINKSPFAVAAKMRKLFFEGKREAEFMVVCDITKEKKETINSLNKAQVHCTCFTLPFPLIGMHFSNLHALVTCLSVGTSLSWICKLHTYIYIYICSLVDMDSQYICSLVVDTYGQ